MHLRIPLLLMVSALLGLLGFGVPAQRGAVDLNGRWRTDDGKEVVIEQSGQNVKATFLSAGDCAGGEKRDFYIQGSLSGNSLTGTMKRCTRNQQLLRQCHLVDPYIAKITATVDQNSIAGKYVPDYITYDCKLTPGGGEPAPFSLTRSGPAAATKPTSEARAEVKTPAAETNAPPIIAMTVASAIDDKGKLVNPRFTFPPNEPQITAIVYVGKTNGGQLKVTWYKVSEDMDGKPFDEKLFEHQIQVKSNERAFSVAKNPGATLELGRYKVVATLEGQTKETQFDISPPRRAGKTPNPPEEERESGDKSPHCKVYELFADQPQSKDTDGAFTLGTNSGGLRIAGAYNWSNDSASQLKKVAWNASSLTRRSHTIAPQGAQQRKRPVAGTSGTAPQSPPPPAATGCTQLHVGGLEGPPKLYVESRTRCSGNYYVDVSARAKGDPVTLGRYGDIYLNGSYDLNPCQLFGSDLPGTKIALEATVHWYSGPATPTSANDVITLRDDTFAPDVFVFSSPDRGSIVKAGDNIPLHVNAREEKEGTSWQTGVRRIWLKATPEGSWDKEPEWKNPSPLPKPCDQKTWEQDFQAIYTVPKNPPPIIEICAYADDYADNEGENCAYFATGEWRGTLREHVEGNLYNETATVLFSFNEESDGTIKGAGRVKLESQPQPWLGDCTSTRKLITPEPLLFPISGKRVGDEFHLELPTDYRLKLLTSVNCPPKSQHNSGSGVTTRSLGMSEVFYHPKVKAQDGATNSFNRPGPLAVSGTIELHRTKP